MFRGVETFLLILIYSNCNVNVPNKINKYSSRKPQYNKESQYWRTLPGKSCRATRIRTKTMCIGLGRNVESGGTRWRTYRTDRSHNTSTLLNYVYFTLLRVLDSEQVPTQSHSWVTVPLEMTCYWESWRRRESVQDLLCVCVCVGCEPHPFPYLGKIQKSQQSWCWFKLIRTHCIDGGGPFC